MGPKGEWERNVNLENDNKKANVTKQDNEPRLFT